MIINKLVEDRGYQGYLCYTGNDITENMIDKCFDIDRMFFQEEYLYSKEKVKEWIKEYNDMCAVLYNPVEDKVIAYCFYLLISDEALELYKSNRISFFTLGRSLFVKPEIGTKGNLFCLSDACLPGWDFVNMHRLMNEYNVYMLCELSKNKFKINNVCIDVVCDYDKTLVNQFHIENYIKTNHNSYFYWGKFDPSKVWTYCRYSNELIGQYNN